MISLTPLLGTCFELLLVVVIDHNLPLTNSVLLTPVITDKKAK